MKKRILILLMIGFCFINAPAQNLFTLNSSYYPAPDIGFHNPAPLVFIGRPQAMVGIHLLHVGFSDDNLRNNFLSYSQPISSSTAFGVRGQYFTSNIFQRGNFSLLLSQKVYKDILSIGLNANLLTRNYDTGKFTMFDFNDPAIEAGTNQYALSFGLGLFSQPMPGLFIGMSIDHLNEPDISIDKSGVLKQKVINMGIAYGNLPVIPQFDINIEDDDIFTQFGIRKSFLDRKFDVYAGYGQFQSEGSSLFAQMEFKIGDLGVWYNFQHSLTADLSGYSSGSHQFGISYTRGKVVSPPEIYLAEIEQNIRQPQLKLSGKAVNTHGISRIEIKRNDEIFDKIPFKKRMKNQDFERTITLVEGSNKIEVTAYAGNNKQSERIFASFLPLAPEINISSLTDARIKVENYELEANITDQIALNKIQVIQNSDTISTITDFPEPKSFDLDFKLKMNEGKNDVKIFASNQWKSSETATMIDYRSADMPAELKIDSPDRPISSSSTIVVNLEIENYDKIKEVVIKLNGTAIDTIKVVKMRGMKKIQEGPIGEKFVENRPVNLESTKNLIEAIALDEQKVPRTSQFMNIIHNPYANDMRYSKKIAIVVGIDDYQDDLITDLDLAVSDADTVARLLNEIYGFDEVYTLFNEKANFENLRAFISDTLKKAGSNDLVVFYFAGHGNQVTNIEGNDEGYLLPCDANIKSDSKNISMDYLRRQSLLSPAKDMLFIIDVCYGGLGIVEKPKINYNDQGKKIDFRVLKYQVDKRSRNIITAGGKKEEAVDGLFTRILKNGLKGAADFNQDMYITSTELSLYLKKHVADEAKRKYNYKQNPQFGSLKVDRGEVVFKRK